MHNFERTALERPSSGFQVLADALPKMIEAMSRPGVPIRGLRLGGITHAVATHLRVEICSLFLLEESLAREKKLVLQEAYGYADQAIGTEKSLGSGLTAKIVNEGTHLIANFRVQDHPDWQGQLDGLLQGHCWCLLGVPIRGAGGKVKGAIKLENKRRDWNVPDERIFIRAPVRNNTPGEIMNRVKSIADSARTELRGQLTDDFESLLFQIETLAQNLVVACANLSSDVRYDDGTEPDLANLDNPPQASAMMSVQYHVEALLTLLRRMESTLDATCEVLRTKVSETLWVVETFRLAISAYQPFSSEDLFLMRTVAAMIAAALDIREAAHIEAFRTLEHALKGPGADLLQLVSGLHRNCLGLDSAGLAEMKQIYRTALYISGPHAVLKGWWTIDQEATIPFKTLYEQYFENRFLYYSDYARLWSKSFAWPSTNEINEAVKGLKVLNNPELIIGALDVLVVNAVEHGGHEIAISVNSRSDQDGSRLEIAVDDDGKGFSDQELEELASTDPQSLYSPRARLGLRFAKRALREAEMGLRLNNRIEHGTVKGARAAVVIPYAE